MFWSADIPSAVEKVNADLRSIHSPNVVVLDAWQLLQENGRLNSAYAADTLHLTKAGYQSLEPALKAMLRSIAAK